MKDKILEKFKTSLNGLSSQEASARLEKYGPNELKEENNSCVQYLSEYKSFDIDIIDFSSEDDIQKLLNSLGLESMQTNKLKNQFKAFVNKDFVDGGKYADIDIASILMGKTKNTTEYSLDELADARLVKTAWNSVNGATDEIKNTNKVICDNIEYMT